MDLTFYCSWSLDASTGVHLTEGQPDPNADQCETDLMQYHSWPPDASAEGYIWLIWSHTLGKPLSLISLLNYRLTTITEKINLHIYILSCSIFKNSYPLNNITLTENPIWAQINWTPLSTGLGHQMPVWGVHLTEGHPDLQAEQMSSWPQMPLWEGYIWAHVNWT